MKQFTSPAQQLGQIGERIACKYLQNKGFSIIERNFTLKCGEIDIIASKGEDLRFIEVKTLKYKGEKPFFKPEDNMHHQKMRKLAKTCLMYADIKKLGDQIPWQIDILAIEYDVVMKRAYIRHHECIY
jgi:putative endonuclease